MGLSRHIPHEKQTELTLRGIDTGRDANYPILVKAISDLSKWIGGELDYIEKNLSQRPEAASGPVVTIQAPPTPGGAPTTATGIIAWGQQSVVAGDNTITFAAPLSSANYGVIPVLYADGALIEFDPSRPTSKTAASFHYNSPGTATLFYFAMVRT